MTFSSIFDDLEIIKQVYIKGEKEEKLHFCAIREILRQLTHHLSPAESLSVPLDLVEDAPGSLAVARQVVAHDGLLVAGELNLLVTVLMTLLQPRGELLLNGRSLLLQRETGTFCISL